MMDPTQAPSEAGKKRMIPRPPHMALGFQSTILKTAKFPQVPFLPMWSSFRFVPKRNPSHQSPKPHHHRILNHVPSRPIMLATAAAWLRNTRHRGRFLFLVICSPLLLPLFCLSLPFLCAAEICCGRRRKKLEDEDADRLRRCEEGCAGEKEEDDEVGLLQRYLEDQLRLVGSVYECGDDDEASGEIVDYSQGSPLLS